jgi:anti-anti-sigma factor
MTAVHAAQGPPSQAPAEISLTALRLPACTIAGLRGALDTATAPALRERLLGMLNPGVKQLTIDLSKVSSCHVAGLAVLVGTQRRATARGIAVCLAAPGPQIAELLRAAGLDRSLTICAMLADALPPQRHGLRAATSPQPAEAAKPAPPGYVGNCSCPPPAAYTSLRAVRRPPGFSFLRIWSLMGAPALPAA